jgi:hypothetical protein
MLQGEKKLAMKWYQLSVMFVISLIAQSSSATITSMEVVGKGELEDLGVIKFYDATLLTDSWVRDLPVRGAEIFRCLQLTALPHQPNRSIKI